MQSDTQTFIDIGDIEKLNSLIQQLYELDESALFRQPVDFECLGLDDYPMIIQKPMDLSTCKKKLNNKEYKYIEECLKEIQRIWDNCKLYNGVENIISKIAIKLEKATQQLIENYFPFLSQYKED